MTTMLQGDDFAAMPELGYEEWRAVVRSMVGRYNLGVTDPNALRLEGTPNCTFKLVSMSSLESLAGSGGLEPPNGGIKIRCLEPPALELIHCNGVRNGQNRTPLYVACVANLYQALSTTYNGYRRLYATCVRHAKNKCELQN